MKTFSSGRRGWLALVALTALSACAGLAGRPAAPPRVSLADIGIDEFGLLEQKLRLRLRLQNPNDVSVGVEGLSYELEVNGRRFAQGLSDQRLLIPRYGEAMLQVSAVSGLASVLRQLRELQRGGREVIDYRLHGRLNVEGVGQVPFDHRGEIPLPSLLGDSPPRREGT